MVRAICLSMYSIYQIQCNNASFRETDVPASDPQSATPYANLTEEQVMGWVQTYTPAWMWAEYTDKITAWITAQYTPATLNPPLPWSFEKIELPVDPVVPIIEPIVDPVV